METTTDVTAPADELLSECSATLDRLYDAVAQFSREREPIEIAALVVGLHRLRDTFSLIYTVAEGALLNQMERGEIITLPDESSLERDDSPPRKAWQHDALARVVADRIESMAVDWDTGERLMGPTQMMLAMLDYAHVDYWRVKKLREISLDPDQYCEKGEPKPKLTIRRSDR